MAKYTVVMRVDGRVPVEVEAKDADEAFEKAAEKWLNMDLDFNSDMEIVDSRPVNCADEDLNIVDYYA